MRVAVIGKGTSSIITTLNLIKRGHLVTIYYDPNTSHINVGESTTPHIHTLIREVLNIDIHHLCESGIFSYKMGINFVNWGSGKSFNHNFYNGTIAHHFDTQYFNKFIHKILEERNLVSYIPERVDSIQENGNAVLVNDRQFDFIVNCAGWEDDDNYIEPLIKTVDSALTFVENLDRQKYDDIHTLHLATEDGWQFGLPFPKQNILKCGYLYSSDYTSEDVVRKKIDKNIRSSFSWKPRYAKQLITSPHVALNGNRLFFLEPLQALGLFYTNHFASFICDYLEEPTSDRLLDINYSYLVEMWAYQLSIAYHYQYGSIYDSNFWRETKSKASNFFKQTINGNEKIFEQTMKYDRDYSKYKGNPLFSRIGVFNYQDHQYIQNGMKGINNLPFELDFEME